VTLQTVAALYDPPFTDTIHVQAYGDVPVEGIVPVTVNAWFTSNRVALTDGVARAAIADDTVTV